MKAKKVLFITSEIAPFVEESENSTLGRIIPSSIQELGHEIRTFSPKWGNINERRNQLHEVIRLSGMNLIINDTDHPLIIKVASLPSARMQIYFIDNDDFFLKRAITCDKEGKEYDDNDERAIFYARGVIETVKKLRWVPDVIHCQGWAANYAPLYIKTAYADEPSFQNTKVVTELLPQELQLDYGCEKASYVEFRDTHYEDIKDICSEAYTYKEMQKIAVKFSDGVIARNADVDASVIEYAKSIDKKVLAPIEGDSYNKAYSEFYETLF